MSIFERKTKTQISKNNWQNANKTLEKLFVKINKVLENVIFLLSPLIIKLKIRFCPLCRQKNKKLEKSEKKIENSSEIKTQIKSQN